MVYFPVGDIKKVIKKNGDTSSKKKAAAAKKKAAAGRRRLTKGDRRRKTTRTSAKDKGQTSERRSANRKKTRKINGELMSKDSKEYKVKNGIKQLAKRGTMTKENNEVSIEFSSEAFLFSIGCTVVKSGKEKEKTFSLLETCSDLEAIDNENIFDTEKFKNKRNKIIPLDDKFPNLDDPIFDLDDAPALRIQKEKEKQQEQENLIDVVDIAGDVVDANLKPGGSGAIRQLM